MNWFLLIWVVLGVGSILTALYVTQKQIDIYDVVFSVVTGSVLGIFSFATVAVGFIVHR